MQAEWQKQYQSQNIRKSPCNASNSGMTPPVDPLNLLCRYRPPHSPLCLLGFSSLPPLDSSLPPRIAPLCLLFCLLFASSFLLFASSLPPLCLLGLPPLCLLVSSSLPPLCLLFASSLPPLCLLGFSSDFEENRGPIEEDPRTQRGGKEENPRRKCDSSQAFEKTVPRIGGHRHIFCKPGGI